MKILRIFFKLIFKYNIKFINNINKHSLNIVGFDCTFYNYLDGFEQVCSYILPVITHLCAYLNSLNIIIYIVIRKPIVWGLRLRISPLSIDAPDSSYNGQWLRSTNSGKCRN